MSLYNRLFGENEEAHVLLGFVGLNKGIFMRYRDCFLNPEGTVVTVISRIGGGNRKDYRQTFTDLKKNENYVCDYDDAFDSTYCYFEFKVPDKYLDTAKKMAPEEVRLSVGEMFKKEVEDSKIPGSDAEKRMAEIADLIFGAIESGEGGIISL